MTADLLQAIVAATTTRVATRRAVVPAASLEARTIVQSAPRGFRKALAAPGLRVIAECKRRSPSRGVLRENYVPAAIAASYERGGAAAISVLTEPTFFDGDLAHLEAVRSAVSVPLLRKDFIVDEYQLVEARACGADAVLLIAAALNDADMRRLMRSAEALRLDVLVEVHDESELDRALEAGATLVGVNNRNLRTLEVDVNASFRLAARLPNGVPRGGGERPSDT
jgi:indole-3-glycerol phosphate synthase